MGIGAFESEEVSKVLEQNILSTKHLLTTASEKIEFNDDFSKFFEINSDEITPIITDSEFDDLNDWVIYVNKDNIEKNDEMDADEGFNTYITNGQFDCINVKTGEDRQIKELSGKEIYLTDEFLALQKSGKGVVRFSDLDDSDILFVITIINSELTKPLYKLMGLINTEKEEEGYERNIDGIAQRFIELLVEAKIGASAVAAEIVINRLVRLESDIFERPDFTRVILPKYRVVSLAKALEKNKAPLTGLAYQYIKRQLLDDDTIEKKDEPSVFDPFFKKTLSTKKWKKHMKYVADQYAKEIAATEV